jgi:hypothetical protein
MHALALSFIQSYSTYHPHPESVRLEAWQEHVARLGLDNQMSGAYRARLTRHSQPRAR